MTSFQKCQDPDFFDKPHNKEHVHLHYPVARIQGLENAPEKWKQSKATSDWKLRDPAQIWVLQIPQAV